MVRVLVDHDLIASPIPVTDDVVIERGDISRREVPLHVQFHLSSWRCLGLAAALMVMKWRTHSCDALVPTPGADRLSIPQQGVEKSRPYYSNPSCCRSPSTTVLASSRLPDSSARCRYKPFFVMM